MKFEIKSYKEEFLDDHAGIEADERNRWEGGGQADREQLKANLARRYAQPDFDPETRLYAFEGEKMVGFITSSIIEEEGVTKGDLRIPFVVKGYEDARGPLLERAIEVLKTKGATSIQAMVSENWGETVAVAKRNGFKFERPVYRQCRTRIDQLDEKKLLDPVDVQLFDYKTHSDVVTKLVMKQFDVSEEDAKEVVARYKDWKIGEEKSPFGFPQKLVFQLLVIENDEVIGRSLGFQRSGENHVDFFATFIKDNDEKVSQQILSAGIREAKKLGIEEFSIGGSPEEEKMYTASGLEFETIVQMYKKEL